MLLLYDLIKATPETISLKILTERHVPTLGLMLVGWGGNNGTTLTAALEANRNNLEWRTKDGIQKANWYGSITQASTVLLGTDSDGQDVFVPMNQFVPMIDPNDIGNLLIFKIKLKKKNKIDANFKFQFQLSMVGTSINLTLVKPCKEQRY